LLEFTREHTWFLLFWSIIALLCTLEFLFPQVPASADRAQRWPINFGLGVLNGVLVSLAPVLSFGSADWAADRGVGLLHWMAAPWWVSLPVTLVLWSLVQYAFHTAMHQHPMLWRVHRVHHCDVHLDASSALRFHPVELIVNGLVVIPVIVTFGLSAGVLATYVSFEIVAGFLIHMNLRIPDTVERNARVLLVTPGLHRIHHSPDRAEADSNYGNVFSTWDRVFGTYREAPQQTCWPPRYGLPEVGQERAGSLKAQLRLPFRA